MTRFQHTWSFPPPEFTLPENEVHVWRVPLVAPASEIERLRKVLADDERQRADRFRFPKDRHHFIISHGALRILLGRYLDMPPEQIRFDYNKYGKPSLARTIGDDSLKFNLSHSGKLALYAFVRQREVGIDVEWMHRRIDQAEQIAERYFSAAENDVLRALPERLKREAFFNCWTRKEAYIKARGRGLSLPLDQFDVSLRPGEPAKLFATRDDPQQALRWTMQAINPGEDYIAALLVEGDGWQVKYWQFPLKS
jgi:4'-phosphopantetheinyl transferase